MLWGAGAFGLSSLLFLYGGQGISFLIFGCFASLPMLLAGTLLPLSGLMAGSGLAFALSSFLLTPLTVTFLGFLCLFPGLLVAFALDQARPTSKKKAPARSAQKPTGLTLEVTIVYGLVALFSVAAISLGGVFAAFHQEVARLVPQTASNPNILSALNFFPGFFGVLWASFLLGQIWLVYKISKHWGKQALTLSFSGWRVPPAYYYSFGFTVLLGAFAPKALQQTLGNIGLVMGIPFVIEGYFLLRSLLLRFSHGRAMLWGAWVMFVFPVSFFMLFCVGLAEPAFQFRRRLKSLK